MPKWWPFKGKQRSSKEQKEHELKLIGERAYAAALSNRLTSGWLAAQTSMDAEIKSSQRALRNRARSLGRENDYVRQFLRALENNVIGQGIPFQAQVKNSSGELDKEINKKIEDAWLKWCRKENCHTAGKLCFTDIERLIIRSCGESGEIYIRMIKKKFGKSKVSFALEVIEADLLDDEMNCTSDAGNEIRMGVELDIWGRPIAYYFKPYHPGDISIPAVKKPGNANIRVSAKEVIGIFKTERPGQTRGIPWISSAILRLHQVQGYEEATVIGARASASLMGFIESKEGEVAGEKVLGADRVTQFEPGVFKTLAPGETVNIPTLNRPNGEFDPFMRAMLRATASGIGVSYETLSRDYSQGSYSSSRLALIDDRDNWRALQSWLIENFHQVAFENWLDAAVLSGELDLPLYELNPEKFTSVRWMPRGWAWVDPAKEVAAYKSALQGGFTTLSDILSQSGLDFDEVINQRKRENDAIRELGLVFDSDAAVSQNNNGNGFNANPQNENNGESQNGKAKEDN
jgi:lambda family phage portal protein